jgi:hypothetical protein
MQKQVNFFEQNVQWFAVGLGGLFLAYMLYAYVLSAPVTAPVGNNPAASPGEVDKLTLEGPVAELKRDIARSEVPDIPQKDYVQGFVAAIHGSTGQPVQLASSQIRSAPMGQIFLPDGVTAPDQGPQKPVTALPIPPVAHVGSHTQGRSQVVWVDPNFEPRPGRPNDVAPEIIKDKDWWSGEFIINGDELYQAFAKAFDVKRIEAVYPTAEPFYQTALVDVQLVRQEIGAGNKVVKEEVVKRLENQPVTVRPDFPPADADPTAFANYLNAVTQSPAELQNPPFYQVLAGDPWLEPGEATDAMLAAMKEANKEERKRMKEQKRQEMLNKQQQVQAARNARAGAFAGEPMMEEDMDAEGNMRPGLRIRQPIAVPAPVAPGARRPVIPGRPGARVVIPAGPMVLGAGKFPVTDGMGPIRIIAHDDTVEPGKTYRYKLRYKLFNPVYRGTAAPPELTKVFALKATDTAWTPKFTMRSKVEFFLASTGREKAVIETFQFKDGQMRKSSLQNLVPGDVITGTGWSLVDTGGAGDKAYALLMDDNGQVVRREPKADRESDRYDELNFEATQPPAVGIR